MMQKRALRRRHSASAPCASPMAVCSSKEFCVASEYIVLLYRMFLLTVLPSLAPLQAKYRRIAAVRHACHTRENPRMSRQDDIPPNAERSSNSVLRQRHA